MANVNYPSDWDSRRKSVYQRDNYTCQNCGRSGGPRGNAELHAHHIVPKAKGGVHSPANLVTVCKQCHNAIHRNSHAPTQGGSVPQQSSKGYFSQLSSITGDIIKFQQKVAHYSQRMSIVLRDRPEILVQLQDTEQTLQRQALEIKATLAAFDVEDAPPEATDAFIEDLKTYFNEIVRSVDNVVGLLDMADELRQETLSDDEFSCPKCDSSVKSGKSFCSVCGAKLPLGETCPECGQNVDVSDGFCSNCGTELPNVDVSGRDNLETIIDDVDDMATGMSYNMNLLNAMTNRLTAHTGDIRPSKSTERIDWRYCPNCGFRHSVFKPNGSKSAECFLCEAAWQKTGIIARKWKMTAGDHSGEKKSNKKWVALGVEKNNREAFIPYINNINFSDAERTNQKFA